MCCKVFQFEDKNGCFLYLNADDKANPELVLKLYVNWYNTDFAPFESLHSINYDDYKFVCSFCPIDFYYESQKIVRFDYA